MDLGTTLWRAQRKVFGRVLGAAFFYQPQVDRQQNPVPLRRLGPVNQWLMERGCTPPWVMSRGEVHAFWSGISNDGRFAGNRPDEYAQKPQGIIHFLDDFWSPEVRPNDAVLELGCNCGANLNGLQKIGYNRLAAVELNSAAIQEMRRVFPQVHSSAQIHEGSLEDVLPRMPDASADVVFTMAVLIHIHPSSLAIFRHMVRVARRYICVVELEAANCSYVFARNYRRVFERLGCQQVRSVLITRDSAPAVDPEYYGYTARLFRVPARP